MEAQSQETSKRSSLCLCRGRVVILTFLFFTLFGVSCASAQAPLNVNQDSRSSSWKNDVVPGEVMVGFLPGVSDENVKAVAAQVGAEVGGKNFPDGNYYLFKFKTDEAANRAVEVLNQDKTKYRIHTAFRNRRMRALEPIPFLFLPQEEGKIPLVRFSHGL